LKVSRQQHAELGPAVAISVSDTGHGIHEADLELLFKKFTQFDADAARPGGGTGLGLYITSMFVKMHNGLIDVESKFGHGTKFTVFLPIQATANYERPQHELENLTSVETAPEEALSASTS
jgi:signal transduction histidine kinase